MGTRDGLGRAVAMGWRCSGWEVSGLFGCGWSVAKRGCWGFFLGLCRGWLPGRLSREWALWAGLAVGWPGQAGLGFGAVGGACPPFAVRDAWLDGRGCWRFDRGKMGYLARRAWKLVGGMPGSWQWGTRDAAATGMGASGFWSAGPVGSRGMGVNASRRRTERERGRQDETTGAMDDGTGRTAGRRTTGDGDREIEREQDEAGRWVTEWATVDRWQGAVRRAETPGKRLRTRARGRGQIT